MRFEFAHQKEIRGDISFQTWQELTLVAVIQSSRLKRLSGTTTTLLSGSGDVNKSSPKRANAVALETEPDAMLAARTYLKGVVSAP